MCETTFFDINLPNTRFTAANELIAADVNKNEGVITECLKKTETKKIQRPTRTNEKNVEIIKFFIKSARTRNINSGLVKQKNNYRL